MNYPLSAYRFRSFRALCGWACALAGCCLAPRAAAQQKPLATVDLDCRAFAIAPDGRIACAAYRLLRAKHYDLERDDIWVAAPDGHRKRIVDGQKLVKSYTPFSYSIRRLAWSPDSRFLTVEMLTEQVTDAHGDTRESELVDLMDSGGKEINVAGTKNSVIENATQAAWLADGQTVAFLIPPGKSGLLYRIGTVRPIGGRGGPIFDGHFFTAVAWDAAHNSAIAIERDKTFSGPIKLVRLGLLREADETLATLPGYLGKLTLSPAGDKVAYFRDGDTIEIRSLANPSQAVSVHAAYGQFAWNPDERRILLKRGSEKESNDLIWVSIPGGAFQPILHDLTFRNFAISPDGRFLVVAQPGSNNLFVYPLP